MGKINGFPKIAALFPTNVAIMKLAKNKGANTQNKDTNRALVPGGSFLFAGRSKMVVLDTFGNLFFRSMASYPITRAIIERMVMGVTNQRPLADLVKIK